MNTILISGNDTGIGKTHVTGVLARALAASGQRVQVVKPVQTGVTEGEPGDADLACQACGPLAKAHTLFRFRRPLAPLQAAAYEGRRCDLGQLLRGVVSLPVCDWRLVEGSGGLAVPLDENGADWADLARELRVQATVLVVEDRLGAINQARLLLSHALLRQVPAPLVVLNQIHTLPEEVAFSNLEGLQACGAPVLRPASPGALLAAVTQRIRDQGIVCCQ